jgi:hypothetical protein
MVKFTEEQLEKAFIELLYQEEILHTSGMNIKRGFEEVLIADDLREFLEKKYKKDSITKSEIESIIRTLENYPSSDLYGSNRAIMKMVSDGFLMKREDPNQKDILIQLIDYEDLENNSFRFVNQLEIIGYEKRIPMEFYISMDFLWWSLSLKALYEKKRLFTMPLYNSPPDIAVIFPNSSNTMRFVLLAMGQIRRQDHSLLHTNIFTLGER